MAKVAEYKKISEEVVESVVTVDDYDEDGNIIGQHEETVTKVIPIMGMVYREMTDAEKAEMQTEALKPQSAEISDEEKISLMLNSIPVEKPTGATENLPFKIGYKWQPVYNGNAFAWQLVKDDNAIGTAENPIIWVDDGSVPLLDNAYYMVDGVRKVYMNGQMVEF